MKFLLINQFGPESDAPTGRILGELGVELERLGHQVLLLATDAEYGKPSRGWRRVWHEGMSHLILFVRGLFQSRVDAVVSLTSPACLAVTAGLLARIHRARHYHWAMDLYPDVGVRLGEFPGGAPARLLSFLMRRAYQGATRVVSLDEDMREYLQKNYGVDSVVIEPFPPDVTWPVVEAGKGAGGQWLYSGNFGRAHEIQVLLEIQKKLEEREVKARLILQGKGPQFLSSLDSAARLGLSRVEWRSPVSLEKLGESLLQSDVVVVTRKAEMKGLLLPSKLMLAELSGRTVLWIGDADGKTASRLAREGRHGVFAADEVEAIAQWLQRRFERESPNGTIEPKAPSLVRRELADRWAALLIR